MVLDPFTGSGQTAIAAIKSGRHYVGYEVDPGYVALAEERIRSCTNQLHLNFSAEGQAVVADRTRRLRKKKDNLITGRVTRGKQEKDSELRNRLRGCGC